MNVCLHDVLDVRGDQLVIEGEFILGDLEDRLALRLRILGRRGGWHRRWFLIARQMNGVVVPRAFVLSQSARGIEIDSGCVGVRMESDEHAVATAAAIPNKTTLRMLHLSLRGFTSCEGIYEERCQPPICGRPVHSQKVPNR